ESTSVYEDCRSSDTLLNKGAIDLGYIQNSRSLLHTTEFMQERRQQFSLMWHLHIRKYFNLEQAKEYLISKFGNSLEFID
ncbi:hypothetical protein ACJX0J_037611, partial [Zea mays]